MIYRKILIGGVTAAAIIGAGGTALAASGSDSTSGSPSSSPSSSSSKDGHQGDKAGKHGKHSKAHRMMRRLEHAQITRHTKDGAVTVDLITGTVTASSSTSVTVQAADHKSQTFAVTKDTKVFDRERGKKPTASSMSKIAKGDHVFVMGTGTSKVTAKRVAEVHPTSK